MRAYQQGSLILACCTFDGGTCEAAPRLLHLWEGILWGVLQVSGCRQLHCCSLAPGSLLHALPQRLRGRADFFHLRCAECIACNWQAGRACKCSQGYCHQLDLMFLPGGVCLLLLNFKQASAAVDCLSSAWAAIALWVRSVLSLSSIVFSASTEDFRRIQVQP